MARTFKDGREKSALTRAVTAYAKLDLPAGKLDKRGNKDEVLHKLFADVIPKKTIPAHEKVILRGAIKGIKHTLVYAHAYGWVKIPDGDITNCFEISDRVSIDEMFIIDYDKLTKVEKLKAILKFSGLNGFDSIELSSFDRILLAYFGNEDLGRLPYSVSEKMGVLDDLGYYSGKLLEKIENLC